MGGKSRGRGLGGERACAIIRAARAVGGAGDSVGRVRDDIEKKNRWGRGTSPGFGGREEGLFGGFCDFLRGHCSGYIGNRSDSVMV